MLKSTWTSCFDKDTAVLTTYFIDININMFEKKKIEHLKNKFKARFESGNMLENNLKRHTCLKDATRK